MAISNSASAQFVSPLALAEPFEDAIHLRKRTPSPSMISTPRPLSVAHASANLSTRELQALVKSQSAFPLPAPDHRHSAFFETLDSPRDEVPPSQSYAYERPLEMARRFSSTVDLLQIHAPPARRAASEKDAVFGLDISDPWGLSFRSETPYDALIDARGPDSRPASPSGGHLGPMHYRRGSTPSLTSSPATSSATTSAASSLANGVLPPGAMLGPDMTGYARRRVSSLNDMPIHYPPPPQPIPLGKSRMANELQYEDDRATPVKTSRRTSFAWFRSSTSSPTKSAAQAPQNQSALPKQRASMAPAPTRPLPSAIQTGRSASTPGLPISPAQSTGASTLRSRSALSIPKLLGKSPALSSVVASPTPSSTSSKSGFFANTFGRRPRSVVAPKGPRALPPPGLGPAPPPATSRSRHSSTSTATVRAVSPTPIAAAYARSTGPPVVTPAARPVSMALPPDQVVSNPARRSSSLSPPTTAGVSTAPPRPPSSTATARPPSTRTTTARSASQRSTASRDPSEIHYAAPGPAKRASRDSMLARELATKRSMEMRAAAIMASPPPPALPPKEVSVV